MTSSMDHDVGFLVGVCRPSLSVALLSGPVVELAAAQSKHLTEKQDRDIALICVLDFLFSISI